MATTARGNKAPTKKSNVEESKKYEITEEQLMKIVQEKLDAFKKEKQEIVERPRRLEQKENLKSPLMNKKVKITPIQKKANNSIKDPSEATMLTRTSRSIMTPINQYGVLVQPLEDWEREYLEKLLKIDLNHLVDDPYENFWASKKAKLEFKKTTRNINSANIILDLSKPYEYILYKIALVNPRVANSWKERYNRGEYDFVIIDGNAQVEEEISFNEKEDHVLETLLENKLNKKYLLDLLRLYGSDKLSRAVNLHTDRDILYNEAKRLARNRKDLFGLYDIMKMNDSDFRHKIIVEDAILFGLIEVRGNEYKLKGGQIIGYHKDEVINYFQKPENQSIKKQIESKIQEKLKK